jgi:hydrogenase maturation protease
MDTSVHGVACCIGDYSPIVAPVLAIGFGNVLLGDDGAGVRLVERLRSRFDKDAITCIDGGTMSFSLLPYVEAARFLLVVDAAQLDQSPGTIELYEGPAMDEFLTSRRRRTVHEVGLTDLLDMARIQGCLPDLRALLCIQPGVIDWSDELSLPVADAIPGAVSLAGALVARWTPA